jgi:CBS domain-containing protein
MQTSSIADWMSTPPILVEPTTTLAEAERIMQHRQVRRLPVVEHGRLIGIITWGDLRAAQPSAATTLSVYEWRALLERATVAGCMTRDPITIPPDATVLAAARLMLDHKIGGLPVVAAGRVVGMITESDVFRLLIADASGAAQVEHHRAVLMCWHCGTLLRRRSFELIGPDDMCWQCHYHLHRCENCRYFDGIACMLNRPDRQSAVPGQHCQSFALLTRQAANLDVSGKK